jgi:hypothetical protein
MITYEVEGTFLVRCANASEWMDASVERKGANRVLKKGEMGWVIGTSDFKIGDGESTWSELPYIKPEPESSPYALRLGSGDNYYTYSELKSILDDLETVADKVYTLETEVDNIKSEISDIKSKETKYYDSFDEFPGIGVQGPIYIDKSKGDAYYFNVDTYEGQGVGWVKLNSFDILQAEL